MQKNNKPIVLLTPIAKLSSLAALLSISEEQLIKIANNKDVYWKPGASKSKTDGKKRITHDAHPTLKLIHQNIKNKLLKEVEYPHYLFGGIPSDYQNKRSCIQNAKGHLGNTIMIHEDISSFFPNTTSEVIKNIWQCLFHFHPDVADILTRLTTYKNCLPQGWIPSSYLSNLIFWNIECDLVDKFAEKGLIYTRFIDDICVSSPSRISNTTKKFIISEIYRMISKKGYSLKRTKHQIMCSNKNMNVNNINVNQKLTIPDSYKNNVRAGVYQLEQKPLHERSSLEYQKKYKRLLGQARYIKSFHPKESYQLIQRLTECEDGILISIDVLI